MRRLLLTAALLAAASAVWSAPPTPVRDVPGKSPTAPPPGSTDSSPRCQTQAVNECRTRCDSRPIEAPTRAEVDRKRGECKQDCVRGC